MTTMSLPSPFSRRGLSIALVLVSCYAVITQLWMLIGYASFSSTPSRSASKEESYTYSPEIEAKSAEDDAARNKKGSGSDGPNNSDNITSQLHSTRAGASLASAAAVISKSKVQKKKNDKEWELHGINKKEDGTVLYDKFDVKQRTSLATLVGNSTEDIDRLARVLKSLDLNMPHDKKSTLLVFNEGNLDLDQKQRIQNNTKRNVSFPEVGFNVFPNGFDPIIEQSTWSRPGRSKFGYQQMCRFWTYRVWLHPVLDQYDTFMRFDTDSCFTAKLPEHYPGLPFSGGGYAYAANSMKSDQKKVTAGLFATAQKYIMENNITVKNPALYQKMKSPRPPMVYNNFEISNITFFRQPHVLNFTRRMAEEEPFGILRTRWGDAPIRTMTLAIFAEESEVVWDAQPDGYKHRHNECVLGKNYHLNQAASGTQEEKCKVNCVMPYKMMVHGKRSSSTTSHKQVKENRAAMAGAIDKNFTFQPPPETKQPPQLIEHLIPTQRDNAMTSTKEDPTKCIDYMGKSCKWWPKIVGINMICVYSTNYSEESIKAGTLFGTEAECCAKYCTHRRENSNLAT